MWSRLQRQEMAVEGLLADASNHTLLVRLGEPAEEADEDRASDHDDPRTLGTDRRHAIYKPRQGERPLWDFPSGTLCQREVAAFVVSDFLGWGLVPPTVLRDGPMGPGSVQLFVPHDPQIHYFGLIDEPQWHEALARMAVFDLVINNADRKGSHVLVGEDFGDDGALFGIDHGLTFHATTKLRTVIWELGDQPLPQRWRADLATLARALEEPEAEPTGQLAELLSDEELTALGQRATVLAEAEALPEVDARRRPYPWPPL